MATGFTIDTEKLAQLDPTVIAQLEKVSPGLFKKGLVLTTVPECTPLSSSMSVCSTTDYGATTDCGATEASEYAPTEVGKDTPDACKYYTVRDGKYYDTAGNEQTSKWAKRQRHRERDEEAMQGGLVAIDVHIGFNSDATWDSMQAR